MAIMRSRLFLLDLSGGLSDRILIWGPPDAAKSALAWYFASGTGKEVIWIDNDLHFESSLYAEGGKFKVYKSITVDDFADIAYSCKNCVIVIDSLASFAEKDGADLIIKLEKFVLKYAYDLPLVPKGERNMFIFIDQIRYNSETNSVLNTAVSRGAIRAFVGQEILTVKLDADRYRGYVLKNTLGKARFYFNFSLVFENGVLSGVSDEEDFLVFKDVFKFNGSRDEALDRFRFCLHEFNKLTSQEMLVLQTRIFNCL